MEINFCRRCGTRLTPRGEGFVCENQHTTYANPKPTVGVILIKPNSRTVVLSRRGIEPRKGELDTFGGFVNIGESFEEAVMRELLEETGLTGDDISPLTYLCSAPNHYPYEGEDVQVLSVIFTATINSSAQPVAQDDVAEIVTISIDDVDLDQVTARDDRYALEMLKNRKGEL